mmetsp:Transcript_11441/g.27908  ORF Transcript_11441/g.27908 Transcript_11441/m.27908 type:complete len:349 (+) Transcript_11441:291-1337(+)
MQVQEVLQKNRQAVPERKWDFFVVSIPLVVVVSSSGELMTSWIPPSRPFLCFGRFHRRSCSVCLSKHELWSKKRARPAPHPKHPSSQNSPCTAHKLEQHTSASSPPPTRAATYSGPRDQVWHRHRSARVAVPVFVRSWLEERRPRRPVGLVFLQPALDHVAGKVVVHALDVDEEPQPRAVQIVVLHLAVQNRVPVRQVFDLVVDEHRQVLLEVVQVIATRVAGQHPVVESAEVAQLQKRIHHVRLPDYLDVNFSAVSVVVPFTLAAVAAGDVGFRDPRVESVARVVPLDVDAVQRVLRDAAETEHPARVQHLFVQLVFAHFRRFPLHAPHAVPLPLVRLDVRGAFRGF